MSDRSDRVALNGLTSDQLDQLYEERDRYHLAWQSARSRVGRAKRARDGELRWANGMWSGALNDLHRYRQAWKSARHRAALYLQSNKNFSASLEANHAAYLQLGTEVTRLSAGHNALLKVTADLITSIGYARHTLADNILGQPGASDDMSLDQIVVHVVAEYRAEQATSRRFLDQPQPPATTASAGASGRCSCGQPDPGPCTPCPTGTPSLHCACVCRTAETAA